MLIGNVTWAAALQAVVSTLGFMFVAYQIWAVRRTLRSNTHDRLYVQYLKILDAILRSPRLYSYFYESTRLAPNAEPTLRAEVQIICEQFCVLFEHADIEKGNLLDKNWDECWQLYILERFAKSPELAQFFEDNRGWYTLSMQKLYDESGAGKTPNGKPLTAQ